jgi:creatinine amidohydrolase
MNTYDMYFANLAWPEIEARLNAARSTVLLFPVGATEPHGPHAPLSTDVLISLGTCERVARQLEGDPEMDALILPALSYGVTRYTSGFPGPIHVSEEALHAILVDICTSLFRQGFHFIVLVNNHFEPEHVQTLHRSIDTLLERTGRLVGYMDLTRKERALALTAEFQKGECHAGCYETSLVLADHPELVNEAIMRALPYVPINLVKVIGQGMKDFKEMGLTDAYNGSPAEATPEEGEASYAVLADMLIALMRELVRGTGGRDVPGFYGRRPMERPGV